MRLIERLFDQCSQFQDFTNVFRWIVKNAIYMYLSLNGYVSSYYKNPIKNLNRIAYKHSARSPLQLRYHRAKTTAVSESIVEHTLSHVYIMQIDSIDWLVDCMQPCRAFQ